MSLWRVVAIVLLCPTLLLTLAAGQQQPSDPYFPRMDELYHRAFAAYSTQDFKTAAENYRQILAITPDDPDAMYNMAAVYARSGNPEWAKMLKRVIDMNVGYDPTVDPDFSSVSKSPEFRSLVAKVKDARPVSRSTVAFTVREKDLIPEGMAYDPADHSFYLSSIHKQKIVKIAKDGRTSDFIKSGQDGIWYVLGMKVDPQRRLLWVASEDSRTSSPTKGYSGVFKYDLRTGKLAKKYIVDNKQTSHLFNDLDFNAAGDVFVTDSSSGAVYAIPHDTDELRILINPGTFIYPNGIALSSDGKRLYIASFGPGISIYNFATKKLSLLCHPNRITTQGIDGMYLYRNSLVAVQNGIGPGRVVRYCLSSPAQIGSMEVLESGNPKFTIPTTGAIVGNQLYYIANAQLRAMDAEGKINDPPQLQNVLIMKVPLR